MENEFYNNHLNIFNFYNTKKSSENNISRFLARLLLEEDYNLFHKELLKEIGITGKIKDVLYQNGVTSIKKYVNKNEIKIKECIPVTLYGGKSIIDSDVLYDENDKHIPDIVLLVNDRLIFIEVKLDNINPQNQVSNQIKEYNSLDKNVAIKPVRELKWEKIISILSMNYMDDFLIRDYIKLISENFSDWINYSIEELVNMIKNDRIKYSKTNEIDRNNLVNVKIKKIMNNYCEENKIEKHKHIDDRGALSIKSSFSTEMQFRLDSKDYSLQSHIWTGETIANTNSFYNYKNNNIDKINSFFKHKGIYEENCKIVPYILFRDHFKYLDDYYIGSNNSFIPKEICDILCKRMNYKNFKKYINDNKKELEKFIPNLCNKIDDIIKLYYTNSGRNNLTISLGYDIIISYKIDKVIELEKNNKINNLIDNSLNIYKSYFDVKK